MHSQDKSTNRSFDFEQLLHPARAFDHPMQVVHDPDLTLQEKRAILSSWASDACALEAAHELRLNATGATARWDDIMDALRALDVEGGPPREIYDPKRPWWRQPKIRHRRGGTDGASA
jgi:hypothetical protein